MSEPITHVPIEANGAPSPVIADLKGFLDVTPARFPNGCDLIFARPGDLAPAGTRSVPVGSLLFYAAPEVAASIRGLVGHDGKVADLERVLDVVPPSFPKGCEVIFMQPGNIIPAGTQPIPLGSMLFSMSPQASEKVRAVMRAEMAKIQAAAARINGAVGRRG
jgi:hypothetical protein